MLPSMALSVRKISGSWGIDGSPGTTYVPQKSHTKIPHRDQQAPVGIILGPDSHETEPHRVDPHMRVGVASVVVDGLNITVLDHEHPLKDGGNLVKAHELRVSKLQNRLCGG